MNTLQRFEVWVSVLMMLICAVFLWESWDLPPGTFEPLGSGPVPKATAFVIIFCCIWVIISSLKNSPITEESESDEGELSINAGLLIFFTTVLYSFFTIPCDAFFLDDDPVSFFHHLGTRAVQ